MERALKWVLRPKDSRRIRVLRPFREIILGFKNILSFGFQSCQGLALIPNLM